MESSLPSLCETWNKELLIRYPDRSWCHRDTSLKLSWSQSMDPLTEQQRTRMLPPISIEPWLRPKKLYTSVEVTPAPAWVPTQRPLVPSFMSAVG